MKCDTNHDLFGERIDGSLDPERSARLDLHLAQCSTCMAEFTALRLAVEALRREGRPQTSADERAAIMAAIDHDAEDRLVASAVAGEAIERRSGVFKRAMLMPAPRIAKRSAFTLVTHVASFAVGIAAAALFWFGSRDATTPDESKAPANPPSVVTNTAPPPRLTPKPATNEAPPAPTATLLRVAGELRVLHNGRDSAQSAAPFTLKPGDTLESKSVGTWRILVGKDGNLELFSEQVQPAPTPATPPTADAPPRLSRGPLFTIDLDAAPLHRLVDGMRSSLDRASAALERAADAMPKSLPAEVAVAAPQPAAVVVAETPPVAKHEPVAPATEITSTRRPPVVVRTESDRLRLETSGPPLEVIPALVLRLRDDDAKVVALVTARLELVREEYERDPKFPRVAPNDAPTEKSILRHVADYVSPAQDTAVVEEAHAYWTRWFDTCADAIVERETFGTW